MANPARASQSGLRFFKKEQSSALTKQAQFKPQWIYLGHGAHSALLAVAANILDRVATGHTLPLPFLKNVLKKHSELFPEQMAARGTTFSYHDRVQLLLDKVKTIPLTQSLAKTFCELINEAIEKNPEQYALYLVQKNDPAEYAQFILAALSTSLDLSIELSVQSQSGSIPQKIKMNGTHDFGVVLMQHQSAVLAQIKQQDRAVQLQKISDQNMEQYDLSPTEATLLHLKQVLAERFMSYLSVVEHLNVMIEAKELSLNTIQDLYGHMVLLEARQNQELVSGYKDSQLLIDAIDVLQSGIQTRQLKGLASQDALIRAIASMASLKRADLEIAFEALDTAAGNKVRITP